MTAVPYHAIVNPDMTPEVPPVIWTYIDGLTRHDIAQIAETVAGDVAFVSPSRTLNKDQFLDMLRALYTAFPDWTYRHDPPELRDGLVVVKWYQSGTHTGQFVLPGMDPVAPTGRSVRMPSQQFFYRVDGGHIVEIRPEPIPGGAPGGILQQIGVGAPPI